MITKGIRGAVTVEENTTDAIKSATLELLSEMIKVNNIDTDMISHVIFTLTEDLNCEDNFIPQFVYLKGASALR